MQSSRKSCESTRASGSTPAKPRCGIGQGRGLRHAPSWRESPELTNDPTAVVWKGSDLPTSEQGSKILGTPLGSPDSVESHLARVARKQVLLDRIPLVPDVQSVRLLLLHCASVRANFQLRVVRPSAAENFARIHDAGLWRCLSHLLQIDPSLFEATVQKAATLLLSLGHLGLRSALRTRVAAISWSDCLPMIQARHPNVAAELFRQMQGFPMSPTLQEAAPARRELMGVMGFEPPTWSQMAAGARAPEREPEDFEPGWVRGWQHEATSRVHRSFREMDLFPRMNESSRALVRSQAGTGGGVVL